MQHYSRSLNLKGIFLFDIDGVIRDVTASYRLAIQKTVHHFTSFTPSIEEIDDLKKEGYWNNDWDTSLELIKRQQINDLSSKNIPKKEDLISIFNEFYFGGDPDGNPKQWKGFIKNEPLLVKKELFKQLTLEGYKWGFVSGAEYASAMYILQKRLGLFNPPLIAMGDAPEKPNPQGLIQLATDLAHRTLGEGTPLITYIGDTVADVLTIENAKKIIPSQAFRSMAIAPPHLHKKNHHELRLNYEEKLREAGAEIIISSMEEVINHI